MHSTSLHDGGRIAIPMPPALQHLSSPHLIVTPPVRMREVTEDMQNLHVHSSTKGVLDNNIRDISTSRMSESYNHFLPS